MNTQNISATTEKMVIDVDAIDAPNINRQEKLKRIKLQVLKLSQEISKSKMEELDICKTDEKLCEDTQSKFNS